METLFAPFFALLMMLAMMLHLFSLPANWLILGLLALWKWLFPETPNMDIGFFLLVGGLAVAAEVLELGAQLVGSKRYGGSGRGALGGLVGGIAGAILGASFFFGFGALFGALGGAYLGCLVFELGMGRPLDVARKAALGTFIGRFLGLAIKLGIGVWILALSLPLLFAPQVSYI